MREIGVMRTTATSFVAKAVMLILGAAMPPAEAADTIISQERACGAPAATYPAACTVGRTDTLTFGS